MSRKMIRSQAVARSRALMQNAAQDSVVGAALGLLLVAGLIASSLEVRHMLADSGDPLASLAAIVGVVVLQGALTAGLCGAVVRKFAKD